MSTSRRLHAIWNPAALLLALLTPPAAEAQVLVEDGEFLSARTVEPQLAGSRLASGGNPGALWSVTHGPGRVVSHHVFGAYDPRPGGTPTTLSFRFDHRWPGYRNSSFVHVYPMILQGGVPYYAARGFDFATPSPLWVGLDAAGFAGADFFESGGNRRGVDLTAPFEVGVRVLSDTYPNAADSAAREVHIDNFAVTAGGADDPVTVFFDTTGAFVNPLTGRPTLVPPSIVVPAGGGEGEHDFGFSVGVRLSQAMDHPVVLELVDRVKRLGGPEVVRRYVRTVPAGVTAFRWREPNLVRTSSPVQLAHRLAIEAQGSVAKSSSLLDLVQSAVDESELTACAACARAVLICVIAGLFAEGGEPNLCGLVADDDDGTTSDDPCLLVVLRLLPPQPSTVLRRLSAMAAVASPASVGGSMSTLRRLRDQLMATTAAGRYYAQLYRTISPALVDAFSAGPSVLLDVATAQDPWLDGFRALLAGRGDQVVISRAMVDDMLAIFAKLGEGGSASLQRTLDYEQRRLQLASLPGQTMQEFWQRVNVLGGPLPCAPSATSLCLQGGRYQVEADWQTADGSRGAGTAVQLTADTGYFWFFDANNVETVVKVLDGCGVNGRRWVFAAGLTDVQVHTTVTDTWTGEGKRYENVQGAAFAPLQDTSFQTCASATAPAAAPSAIPARFAPSATPAATARHGAVAAAGACMPGPGGLCLRDGRFRVAARWRVPDGGSGAGTAVQLTADTGYFWFFDARNVETVVKVLDGCGVNDRFWVFAGGLTDVGVELEVTDTMSGTSRTYTNPLGRAFAPIQDTDALGGCR
jgi:hypothetical protein